MLTESVVTTKLNSIEELFAIQWKDHEVKVAFDVEATGPAAHPQGKPVAFGFAFHALGTKNIYTISFSIRYSRENEEGDFVGDMTRALEDLTSKKRTGDEIITELGSRYLAFSDELFAPKPNDSWKSFMLERNLQTYLEMMLTASSFEETRDRIAQIFRKFDTMEFCKKMTIVNDNPYFDCYFLLQLLDGIFPFNVITYPVDTAENVAREGRTEMYCYARPWEHTRGPVLDVDSAGIQAYSRNPNASWLDTSFMFERLGYQIYRVQGHLHAPEVDAENMMRSFIAMMEMRTIEARQLLRNMKEARRFLKENEHKLQVAEEFLKLNPYYE